MGKHMGLKITAGMLVFLGLALGGVGMHCYKMSKEQAVEVKDETVAYAAEVDYEEIEKMFAGAGRLVCVENPYSGFYSMEQTKKWGEWDVPMTKSTATLTYTGCLNAGYDLSKVEIKLNEETKSIFITLPKVQVENYVTDYGIENRNEGWFTGFSEEDIEKAVEEAKETELTKAEEAGLYEQAEAACEENVKGLITQVEGLDAYEVVFNVR